MSRGRTNSSASTSTSTVHESQLIGSILAEDNDGDDTTRSTDSERKDPILRRSTSAPPQLAMLEQQPQVSGETILPDDIRLSPEYYTYYYSQRPLDPRLPPPIFNWTSWQYSNSRNTGVPGGEKDFLFRAGLKLGDLANLLKDKSLTSDTTSTDTSQSTTSSLAELLSGTSGSRGGLPEENYILSQMKQQGSQTSGLFDTTGGDSSSHFDQNPFFSGIGLRNIENDRETLGTQLTGGTTGTGLGLDNSDDLRLRLAQMSLNTNTGSSLQSGSLQSGTLPLQLGSQLPPLTQSLFPSSVSFPSGMGSLGVPGSQLSTGFGGQSGPSSMGQVYPFGNLSTPSPMMAVMGYGQLQQQPRLGPDLSSSLPSTLSSLPLQDRRPGPPSGGPIGSSIGMPSRNGVPDYRSPPPSYPGLNGTAFGRGRWPEPQPQQQQQSFNSFRGGGGSGSPRGSGRGGFGRGQGRGRRTQGSFPSSGGTTEISGSTSSSTSEPTGDIKSGPTTTGDFSSRSAWLDDFRLNKANSNLTLKDVVSRGLMLELATDQYGSRFIQQRLENATVEEKQAAFEQLLPDTLRLCTDVFGNYVIQKFFEFGTFEQKKILASKLVGNVLALSLQMYGCRVIQKALDVSDVETQALLVRELTGHVMEFVKDQNGNHVIQKCIEKVPSYLIQFIVEAFSHQIFNLSTHPYGCRVVQRLLENCSESQRNAILAEILENVEDLCKNQYGNYVIQHVLIHGTPWHRGAIIRAVRGKILPLSKHKFASNVIEKCFAHASKQHRALLVEEVLGKEDRDPSKSPLISMVKDQYANYVIQKMVDVVDEEQRNMILQRIKRYVPNLRKIPYGKHIIARIEKLTGKPILP